LIQARRHREKKLRTAETDADRTKAQACLLAALERIAALEAEPGLEPKKLLEASIMSLVEATAQVCNFA